MTKVFFTHYFTYPWGQFSHHSFFFFLTEDQLEGQGRVIMAVRHSYYLQAIVFSARNQFYPYELVFLYSVIKLKRSVWNIYIYAINMCICPCVYVSYMEACVCGHGCGRMRSMVSFFLNIFFSLFFETSSLTEPWTQQFG